MCDIPCRMICVKDAQRGLTLRLSEILAYDLVSHLPGPNPKRNSILESMEGSHTPTRTDAVLHILIPNGCLPVSYGN